MSQLVADASFIGAVILPDEQQPWAAEGWQALTAMGTMAPPHWRLEIINMLIMACRRNRITLAQRGQLLAIIDELPVTFDNAARDSADAVVMLADSHALTSYDAAYLDIARRRGLVLATGDGKLAKAAANEGLRLWSPR